MMRKLSSVLTPWWTLVVLLIGLGVCVAEDYARPVPLSSTVTVQTRPTGPPETRVVYETPAKWGAPDLTYNCAIMPNICTNINILYPLDSDKHIDKSRNNGKWHIELHWDANTKAKHERRQRRCGNFKAVDVCPSGKTLPITGYGLAGTNGPIAYVDKDGKGLQGAIQGRLAPPSLVPTGAPDLAYISSSGGQLVSMIWSCEEWPPASTIEGDRYDSVTICAPMNAACAVPKDKQKLFPHGFVRSEQNFQGAAQSKIAQIVRAKGDKDKKKAWTYHQLTTWATPDRSPWAAHIQWGDALDVFHENKYPVGKRDLDMLARENMTDEAHHHQQKCCLSLT